MFYKHWKKISLALTGFFWASCEVGTTTEPPLYGAPPQFSSSSITQGPSSSSVDNISSSSEPMPMPAYGVPQMYCEVTSESDATFTCENGYTCTEKQTIVKDPNYNGGCITDTINGELTQVCLDYGIPYYHAKSYECDNGYTYDENHFRKIYKNSSSSEATSSSAVESSSSADVTCMIDGSSFFYKNRTELYTESQAKSNATSQAKKEASSKISEIIRDRFKSKDAPKCLEDMRDSLVESFVVLYGSPGTPIPSQYKCSDGTTRPTESYLEQQAFDEEQVKKKPQYDEKYKEFYKEESEKQDKKINDCLNSETTEE